MRANINDRQTVEVLYPREAFEEDAALNALDKNEVVSGVRIDSSPDSEGWFDVVRARRHVGELMGSAEAVFLPANQQRFSSSTGGSLQGKASQQPDVAPDPARADYDAFVDRILDAARSADIPAPTGSEDRRLQGFHGG